MESDAVFVVAVAQEEKMFHRLCVGEAFALVAADHFAHCEIAVETCVSRQYLAHFVCQFTCCEDSCQSEVWNELERPASFDAT